MMTGSYPDNKNMKDKIRQIEEALLKAMDTLAEQSDDKMIKILADLFKSAILKKYKDAFDVEFSQGKVHKENVDKAVDFCYSDICVSIRRFSGMTDDEKDEVIKKGKSILGSVKQMILDILVSQNVEVVSGS